jgi:hypothetical protein
VFVIEGTVYKLLKAKDKGYHVSLGGTNYVLQGFKDVQSIEESYQASLERRFRLEALDEYRDIVREICLREDGNLVRKIASMREYQVKNAGFVKNGGMIFAYVRVPKYAMRHPEKKTYHPFKSCRVAIPVACRNGQIEAGIPCVIEGYAHPFLHGVSEFNRICMGESYGDPITDAASLAKRLGEGANIVMQGYPKGVHPYNQLSNFGRISRKDAESQGYLITNIRGGQNGR